MYSCSAHAEKTKWQTWRNGIGFPKAAFEGHHLNQAKFSCWVYENNKLENQFTTLYFAWQVSLLEINIPARNTTMKITKTSRLLPDLLSQKETISKRHQIISKLTQPDGRAMKTVNLVLNKYRNSFKNPNANFSICQLSAACERFEPRSHFKSIGWVWSSGWT